MSQDTVNLSDGTTQYPFWINKIGLTYKNEAGIYAFASPSPNGGWYIHYVGETSNLDDRIGNGLKTHHRLACAQRRGATHILVRAFTVNDDQRRQLEARFRTHYDPPCNKQ